MRRLWHLAPFLVVFGVLLASFPSNAKDVFINETLVDIKESSLLQDTDGETDALSFFPSRIIHPPPLPPLASTISNNLLINEKTVTNEQLFVDSMNCDFSTGNCKWFGHQKWYWVRPSYNQIKKDSPAYDPYGNLNF